MPESSGRELELNGVNLPPQIINKEEQKGNNIPLPYVFHLGIQLEHLRNLVDSTKKDLPKKQYVLRLLTNIESAIANYDRDGVVSEMISDNKEQIGEKDKNEKISQNQAEELKKQVTSWIHLLARELGEETRIPASESGILDIDILTERPNKLFRQEVWEWLDDRPKQDVTEACRSVAVDCATASVMLSLRAVEHCLREWYEQENESLDAAWGRVLDQLMEEYVEDNKKNDTVLTQLSDLPPVLTTLYYLKEKRNEVNHPEESPTPREARRTLLIISSTITEIYEVLQEENKGEEIDKSNQFGQLQFEEIHEDYIRKVPEEKEDLLFNVIKMICDENEENVAEKGKIIEIAEESGIEKEEADELLDHLLMSGRIYEPAEDQVKII